MKKLFQIFDLAVRWTEDIVSVVTLVMIVGISAAQIVLRYFFRSGFVWVDEVVQALMVGMVMFGSAIAVRWGGHTELKGLVNKPKSKKIRMVLRAIISIISLAVLIILFVAAFRFTADSTELKSVILRVPRTYYYISMPLGFGLSIYEFIKRVKSRITDDPVEKY